MTNYINYILNSKPVGLCLNVFLSYFPLLLFFSFDSDRGTVQKVVVLPANSSARGELILEELEVFKV